MSVHLSIEFQTLPPIDTTDIRLTKGSASGSLHTQLLVQLRERILDGTLPAGTRISTELELARNYQVSRGTIRQAMTALVSEGLVERIQGRGTFVRELAPPLEVVPPTKRIGLIIGHPGGELDMDILLGVENAARSRGYQFSFAHTEENMQQQSEDIDRLQADHVAGMVILPINNMEYDAAIWRLHAERVPFVLVDRYFPALDCDYVVSDNLGGGYRATEHLIILGHKRIGFVYSYTGTFRTTSVRDRYDGYRKALREYGLAFDETLVYHVPRLELVAHPFAAYLEQPELPTAIFAVHDNMALSLMQAVQQHGIRIPDDVAIIGFDDVRFAPHLNPPLTTMAQARVDLGVRAGHLLINRIEGLTGSPKHIVLPTSLIVRESCGVRLRMHNSVRSL